VEVQLGPVWRARAPGRAEPLDGDARNALQPPEHELAGHPFERYRSLVRCHVPARVRPRRQPGGSCCWHYFVLAVFGGYVAAASQGGVEFSPWFGRPPSREVRPNMAWPQGESDAHDDCERPSLQRLLRWHWAWGIQILSHTALPCRDRRLRVRLRWGIPLYLRRASGRASDEYRRVRTRYVLMACVSQVQAGKLGARIEGRCIRLHPLRPIGPSDRNHPVVPAASLRC
jgi:hypothetical protein